MPTTRHIRYCQTTLPDGRHPLQGPALLSSHKFAANGAYTITVTMRFDGCGRRPQTRTATTGVRVDSASTGLTPEGVSGTSVKIDDADPREPAPRRVAVSVSALNTDRYAEFVFVDWGDGTADVLRTAVPSWCATSPPPLDPEFPMHVEHTYAAAGRYTIYVTVQSATCEGGRGTSGTNSRSMRV